MLDIKEYLKKTRTVLVTQDAFDELVRKASAEPRKGKWAGKGDSEGFGIFICGTCGKFAMMKSNFCPNCGADMREEEQDELHCSKGQTD